MIRITGGSRCAALLALMGLSVGLSVFGCSAADSSAPAPVANESVGSIGLALQAGGVTLNSVSYTIVGTGFSKSGTIDVKNSTLISAVIGGIPAGTGYSITLSASDATNNGTTCTGSASFSVTGGATTSTQVHLQCKAPSKTGSLMVSGVLNICPVIDSLSVAPAETTVGSAVGLSASGSDSDHIPSALSYSWSSSSGTIAGASSPNASLTCTAVGPVTVTLTVSDGDCTDTLSQTVACSPAASGSGGSAGLGGSGGASAGSGGASAGSGGASAGSAGAPSAAGSIKINEVESNGGIPGDWVELYNAGSAPIDLSGYIFKDNDDTHSYAIPSGTVVAPGAYFMLEEAAFGFGLGAAESARLYLPGASTIVDSYSWTAHATTTYGRCPNGTGAFGTSATVTKGAANDCGSSAGSGGAGGVAGAGGSAGSGVAGGAGSGGSGGAVSAFEVWPGQNAVVTVDVANTFPSNLSGLFYDPPQGATPAVLWGALNGPSKIYRLLNDGTNWVPDTSNGWSEGKTLHYANGLGSPDTEGVSKAEAGSTALYISSERDNEKNTVSRLVVLMFDGTGSASTISALHDWDLTSDLPVMGANLGLEAIAWIPDSFLVSKGFIDESKGLPYDPASYANHAGGLFFVGIEGNGTIYAYALDHVGGGYTRIATIASGNPGIMDLNFDRDVGYLWAACDDSCQGRTNVLDIDTRVGSPSKGKFYIRRSFERPSTMPNINNEGFAIAPEASCVGGFKSVFYSDDSNTSLHAIRRDAIPCGPFLP
ncbi:MAG TPA: lamin tail domain-containing protein [Polyangiaceae bacterium]|nr:lamin tail domain-containing protein [Polyangiaceae bacterium]